MEWLGWSQISDSLNIRYIYTHFWVRVSTFPTNLTHILKAKPWKSALLEWADLAGRPGVFLSSLSPCGVPACLPTGIGHKYSLPFSSHTEWSQPAAPSCIYLHFVVKYNVKVTILTFLKLIFIGVRLLYPFQLFFPKVLVFYLCGCPRSYVAARASCVLMVACQIFSCMWT